MEDADRSAASGEDAAAVDGVHFEAVTGGGFVSEIGPAGRTGEFESQGIGVGRSPFGDQVGDDASVVFCRGMECATNGSAQVDALHSHVTGNADVVEEAERLPQSSVESEEWQRPDWCRHPASEM